MRLGPTRDHHTPLKSETPVYHRLGRGLHADEDGRLYLGISDTGVENNSGEFEASVTVTHP
jgi:hypothetical protein